MTKEEAIEALKEHKRQIDKEYINTRNSKAIETVLSMLKEKDKMIDLMSEQLTTPMHNKEYVKQYFENKVNGGNKR